MSGALAVCLFFQAAPQNPWRCGVTPCRTVCGHTPGQASFTGFVSDSLEMLMLRSLRVPTPLSLAITLSAAGVLMSPWARASRWGCCPIHDNTGMGVAAISLALAVGQFAWGAIRPLAGALADRHGPRGVLWVGVLTLALGCACLTPWVSRTDDSPGLCWRRWARGWFGR